MKTIVLSALILCMPLASSASLNRGVWFWNSAIGIPLSGVSMMAFARDSFSRTR